MRNSRKVIDKIVEMSSNDELPMDLNELSPEHFNFLDRKEHHITMTVKMVVKAEPEADMDMFETDFDYEFKSRTEGIEVVNTEIEEMETTKTLDVE